MVTNPYLDIVEMMLSDDIDLSQLYYLLRQLKEDELINALKMLVEKRNFFPFLVYLQDKGYREGKALLPSRHEIKIEINTSDPDAVAKQVIEQSQQFANTIKNKYEGL